MLLACVLDGWMYLVLYLKFREINKLVFCDNICIFFSTSIESFKGEWVARPNFFGDPVVLELICCRTRAKRLISDSKTTVGLRKIWTSGTKQFQKRSSPTILNMSCEPLVPPLHPNGFIRQGALSPKTGSFKICHICIQS